MIGHGREAGTALHDVVEVERPLVTDGVNDLDAEDGYPRCHGHQQRRVIVSVGGHASGLGSEAIDQPLWDASRRRGGVGLGTDERQCLRATASIGCAQGINRVLGHTAVRRELAPGDDDVTLGPARDEVAP